jgi:hypothetical protein
VSWRPISCYVSHCHWHKSDKKREIFQLRKVQILAGQLQEVRGGDELPQQARPEEGPRAEGGGKQTLQGEQGPVFYKTFCGRKLRLFIIARAFVPGKAIEPGLMFVGKAKSLP